MRPRLQVHFPGPSASSGSVMLDGKPLHVTSMDLHARAGELVEVLVTAHPRDIEVDVDAGCLRLNGLQLPEETGRALLAQLKRIYGD